MGALASDLEDAMAHADTMTQEDVDEALQYIIETHSKDPVR